MENIKSKITKVDLITGFLGAGKTTFIRRYAAYLRRKDIPFAVVENEYGRAGVDTAILREENIQTRELAGGCLCCTLKIGFHDMLLQMHEEGAERIIVEPSGIYEVAQFFNVMSSEHMVGKCKIGMVLCIVDPSQMNIYDEEATAFLTRQLTMSGGVIFSRSQCMSAEVMESAGRKLKQLRPDTPVLSVQPWEDWTDDDLEFLASVGPHVLSSKSIDTDHSTIFQSCTLVPKKCFLVSELDAVLHKLMDGSFGDIRRIKGFLLTTEGMMAVNVVPGQIRYETCKSPMGAVVNLIGLHIDRPAIRRVLDNKTAP